jgi:hypothetical protein
MFIKKLIKRDFLSFYHDDLYYAKKESFRGKKIIDETEDLEFKTKKELEEFVKESFEKNPQTYTSTIMFALNQGVVDSCEKREYKKRDIDVNNIQILCINNEYSFYSSIYDIKDVQSHYDFEVDFVYSVFAPIDYVAKERKNVFYILVFKSHLVVLGYENNKPIFGDITALIDLDEEEEEEEEVVSTADIIEDLSDDLDISEDIEEIEDLDEEEFEDVEEKITTNIEMDILNFLKDSLKEYYENYSNDFIEKIIILDVYGIDKKIKDIINDQLLIPTEYQHFDLLSTLNRMALEEA